MIIFLTITSVLLAIVIIGIVLLQQGKGSDLGSAFGSGSSNTMFGPSTAANPLTKITAFLSAAFLILSFTITWQARDVNQEVILQEQQEDVVEEGILPDPTTKK